MVLCSFSQDIRLMPFRILLGQPHLFFYTISPISRAMLSPVALKTVTVSSQLPLGQFLFMTMEPLAITILALREGCY